jgi:hypothetical protein
MIGRLRRIRLHNSTQAGLRFENARGALGRPLGGLDYPAGIWRRDQRLMQLADLVQDWLTLHAGPIEDATLSVHSRDRQA